MQFLPAKGLDEIGSIRKGVYITVKNTELPQILMKLGEAILRHPYPILTTAIGSSSTNVSKCSAVVYCNNRMYVAEMGATKGKSDHSDIRRKVRGMIVDYVVDDVYSIDALLSYMENDMSNNNLDKVLSL